MEIVFLCQFHFLLTRIISWHFLLFEATMKSLTAKQQQQQKKLKMPFTEETKYSP